MTLATRKAFCRTEAKAYILAAERSTQSYVPFFIYKYIGKPIWLVKCNTRCPTGYRFVDSVSMLPYNSGM